MERHHVPMLTRSSRPRFSNSGSERTIALLRVPWTWSWYRKRDPSRFDLPIGSGAVVVRARRWCSTRPIEKIRFLKDLELSQFY